MQNISWRNPLVYVILFLLVLPLAFTDILPFQDYPDWLYQGLAFAHYHSHGATYNQYLNIKPYLVPNSGSTLIMALFMSFMNPILAGKITLSLWLLGMPICYIYFYRSFQTKGNILQLTPLLLLYNIRFYHGNLSFLLSLPLMFFVLGYYKRRLDRLKLPEMIMLVLLFILLFLFHFIGFFICLVGLLILTFEKHKFRFEKYVLPFIAMVPALFLAVIYSVNQSHHGEELAFMPGLSVLGKIANIAATWAIAFNFDDEPISNLLLVKSGLNLLFFGIIIVLVYNFINAMRKGNIRWNLISLFGLTMIFIGLFLPTMFFYITDGDSRLFWIGALLIIPVINIDHYAIRKTNMAIFLGIFLFLIALNSWQLYAKGNQNEFVLKNIEKCLGPNKRALMIMGNFVYGDRVSADLFKVTKRELIIKRLVPDVESLMRLPLYYNVKYDIPYSNVFQTSLFESKNYRIPLMVRPYPTPQAILDDIDEYQYLVIVGKEKVVQYFNNYFSQKTEIVCFDSVYSVLKIF